MFGNDMTQTNRMNAATVWGFVLPDPHNHCGRLPDDLLNAAFHGGAIK